MELFKVICVTCQAKLSVRNEALIGQIVACPRCNSMVEVAPPAHSAVVDPESSAAVPATTSPPPSTQTPTAPNPATAISPTDQAVDEAAIDPATPEAGHADPATTATATVGKYKLIAWSLASFFVGATLVGAVLWSRGDSTAEPANVASSETTTTPNKPATNVEPVATATQPNQADANTPTQPTTTEPPLAAPAVVPEPEVQPATETLPVTPTVQQSVTPTPSEPVPDEQAPDEPTAKDPSPRLARRFDPLKFDPENLTLATVDAEPAATDQPSVADQPESTVPPQIDLAVEPEQIPSTAPLVRRGPASPTDTHSIDAAEQLKLTVPAVTIEKMPLAECLQLFSQLSGLPISIAPEQLLMAGITAERKVSLAASEASLGDMLAQVLTPLHLEVTTQGEQVVVVRQEATKTREINYPINDLVSSATSKEQLAGWVEQFVAPTTWQTAGGQGTLVVEENRLRISQSQQVQYQVLILLERLRLARNLPPRSRYPVKRLVAMPASQQLGPTLRQTTTFTFTQFTPLQEVFTHWQTELDVPLLVDWTALASADLSPHSTVACAIIDEPWSVALEKVLEPLGLGWRVATSGAIEITSAEKVLNQLQLELFPLADGTTVDIDALRTKLGPSNGELAYDPAGNVVLALQPATNQRILFNHLQQRQLLAANN